MFCSIIGRIGRYNHVRIGAGLKTGIVNRSGARGRREGAAEDRNRTDF